MQGSPRRSPNPFRAELLWDEKFNGPPRQAQAVGWRRTILSWRSDDGLSKELENQVRTQRPQEQHRWDWRLPWFMTLRGYAATAQAGGRPDRDQARRRFVGSTLPGTATLAHTAEVPDVDGASSRPQERCQGSLTSSVSFRRPGDRYQSSPGEFG